MEDTFPPMKIALPILVTEAGIFMVSIAVLLKAKRSIVVRVDGRSKETRDQDAKAYLLIIVKPSFRVTFSRLVELRKAY